MNSRILLLLSGPGVSRPKKSPRAMTPPESASQVQPLLPLPSGRPDARRIAISGGRPPFRLWFRTGKTASEHINCPVLNRFSERSLALVTRKNYFLNKRPSTPFFSGSGGGRPRLLQMAASIFSSEISEPSDRISSPIIIAGATGKSSSKYSSVLYSAGGFEVVSISISYFSPNLGIMALKCFHGLPLGSFRKNLTFNMVTSSFNR